jgi:hypothetical protein
MHNIQIAQNIGSTIASGLFFGDSNTYASLPTTNGTNPVTTGDWTILTEDDGTNPAGIYEYNGTSYVLVYEFPEPEDFHFVSDTALSPAEEGNPTDAEIAAYIAANNLVDTIVYYTGTDTATDAPIDYYHVDASGNIIANTFIGQTDTPDTYTGYAGYSVVVSDDETELVYCNTKKQIEDRLCEFQFGISAAGDEDQYRTDLNYDFPIQTVYEGVSDSNPVNQAPDNWVIEAQPILDAGRKVLYVLEPFGGPDPIPDGNLDYLLTELSNPASTYYGHLTALFDKMVEVGRTDCVWIALMHEANGINSYPWLIYNTNNDATKYIAVYKLIVDLARSRGVQAKYIQWFLTQNAGDDGTDMGTYYVGDDYVDLIGVSDYMRSGVGYAAFRQPGELLQRVYQELGNVSCNKFIIAEHAAAPVDPTDSSQQYIDHPEMRAEYYAKYPKTIRNEFPRVSSIVYFFEDKSGAGALETDWRPTTESEYHSLRNAICDTVRNDKCCDDVYIGTNLMREDQFDLTNWSTSGTGATLALSTDVPEPFIGMNSLEFTKPAHTPSGGLSSNADADYQLYYNVYDNADYTRNDTYTISFYAKYEEVDPNPDVIFTPGIRAWGGSFDIYSSHRRNKQLNEGWQLFNIQVSTNIAPGTNAVNWRFPWFGFGNIAAGIKIKIFPLKVERGCEPTPYVLTNGATTGSSVSSITVNTDNSYTHNDGNGGTPVVIDPDTYDSINMSWSAGALSEDVQYTPDFQDPGMDDLNKSILVVVNNEHKTGGEIQSVYLKVNNPVTTAGTVVVEKISGGAVTTIATLNVPVSAAISQNISVTGIAGQSFANGDAIRFNTASLVTSDNLSGNIIINYKEI